MEVQWRWRGRWRVAPSGLAAIISSSYGCPCGAERRQSGLGQNQQQHQQHQVVLACYRSIGYEGRPVRNSLVVLAVNVGDAPQSTAASGATCPVQCSCWRCC